MVAALLAEQNTAELLRFVQLSNQTGRHACCPQSGEAVSASRFVRRSQPCLLFSGTWHVVLAMDVGAPISLCASSERERVRLGAGLREGDLERPLADGVELAHELVQPPGPENTVPFHVDVDAV
jgi:hypothetical protein